MDFSAQTPLLNSSRSADSNQMTAGSDARRDRGGAPDTNAGEFSFPSLLVQSQQKPASSKGKSEVPAEPTTEGQGTSPAAPQGDSAAGDPAASGVPIAADGAGLTKPGPGNLLALADIAAAASAGLQAVGAQSASETQTSAESVANTNVLLTSGAVLAAGIGLAAGLPKTAGPAPDQSAAKALVPGVAAGKSGLHPAVTGDPALAISGESAAQAEGPNTSLPTDTGSAGSEKLPAQATIETTPVAGKTPEAPVAAAATASQGSPTTADSVPAATLSAAGDAAVATGPEMATATEPTTSATPSPTSSATESAQLTESSQTTEMTASAAAAPEVDQAEATLANEAPAAEVDALVASTTSVEDSFTAVDRLAMRTASRLQQNNGTASPSDTRNIQSQVTRHLNETLQSVTGGEKLSLQLNPENLGQVEIEFTAVDDKLNVLIIASSGEAEKALREGLQELTDALVDRSTRFQHVEVKVDQRESNDDRQNDRNNGKRDRSEQEERGRQQNSNRQQNQQSSLEWASSHLGG